MATVIVTVGLAFAGYLATYLNGIRLSQRQARLTRVNEQLSDLYGPLFALMEANSRTYDYYAEKYASHDGSNPFRRETPPTDRELAEWRAWATTVFIPNIQAMRDVIVTKADLLLEEEMPEVLLEFCAHVHGYEITAARWSEGNYDEHLSILRFPGRELRTYLTDRFTRLKAEQSRLLGHRRRFRGRLPGR
ncbi:hypothetical protein [Streptomyces sp. JJ36]|uniref:hypothetical protein n=1 Tax=Streptomyces sp. JJ36 TaxID=2736645 RepID=UPI001F3435B3|nr:hypothetical protein [Streptomyces sp. JJ36]MCF6524076.1 hypothetical protein [Streptomyces sp. JJ36]